MEHFKKYWWAYLILIIIIFFVPIINVAVADCGQGIGPTMKRISLYNRIFNADKYCGTDGMTY